MASQAPDRCFQGALADRLVQVLQEAFKRHKIDKVRRLRMHKLSGVDA